MDPLSAQASQQTTGATDMTATVINDWVVDGPTTLHGYDDDLVYMLVRVDTSDRELEREVALVGAWDLEGERYARVIAAVPKLLAACQAVAERWEHGDLAEAARMCAEAVQQATGGVSPGNQEPADTFSADHDQHLEQLVAKAEAAGLKAEDFDETVHDLASGIAADINNAGLEDQLRYLIDEWGGEAAGREIDRLAEERKTDATARRNQ
jgi:hypothetical protein